MIKLAVYAVAAAVVSAILWGAWGQFTDWIREPVVAELGTEKEQHATCRRSNVTLEDKITDANGQTEAARKRADERYREGVKAGIEQERRARTHDTRAAAIVASAPLDADACVSARKRARQFILDRRSP